VKNGVMQLLEVFLEIRGLVLRISFKESSCLALAGNIDKALLAGIGYNFNYDSIKSRKIFFFLINCSIS
jgi:hypothetical protein